MIHSVEAFKAEIIQRTPAGKIAAPEDLANVVAFLTEIEQLQVEPDLAAKIVIDERSGIIVMGRDVQH